MRTAQVIILITPASGKNARVGGESPRTIYFYKVLKAKTARVASHLTPENFSSLKKCLYGSYLVLRKNARTASYRELVACDANRTGNYSYNPC